MSKCKYCGREDEGNAGDYYHQKDCEARHLSRTINEQGASLSQEELAKLEKRLEQARYVGD